MSALQTPGNGAYQKTSLDKEVKKYLRILNKRKSLIFGVSLVTFIVWVGIILYFQSKPIYVSNALLTFQDPHSLSAVGEVDRTRNISKVQLLETSLLLGQVVEEMQLNVSIRTENISRKEAFLHVMAPRDAKPGYYTVEKLRSGYKLRYAPLQKEKDKVEVASFNAADTVRFNNFEFCLNEGIFTSNPKLKEFTFVVKEFERAIDGLRNLMSYRMDRYQSNLTINVKHTSKDQAVRIVKKIAEKFVELNLKIKRHNTEKVLKILENELRLAKTALDEASEKLKSFRQQYPWVVLTSEAGQGLMAIASVENQLQNVEARIKDLQGLQQKVNGSLELGEKIAAARELLTYLVSEGVPVATAYQAEFTNLETERANLLNTVSPSSTFFSQNNQTFAALIQKIQAEGTKYIEKLKSQALQLQQNVNQRKQQFRNLPEKELQLAELIREREVKNDLYQRVLEKYNAKKIDNEVEVSEVFIVDYGTPPTQGSMMADLVKKGLLGIILAIGMGIGVAIVVELFDKTAETADELQQKSSFKVIGSIPVIKSDEEVPENFEEIKGKRDSKLITLDYAPTIESEAYREIRTKLLFKTQMQNKNSLLITSLHPNDGKSLTCANLAITIAQQKIPTLLIDADLRRGVLHNVFGNKKRPGLTDFIVSEATINDANIEKLVQDTFVPNLYMVTTGSPVPNPTELIGSARFAAFMNFVKEKYGMVMVDTAPIYVSSDAAIITNLLDYAAIVVRSGVTNLELLEEKINEYPEFRKKVEGVILNMVKRAIKRDQYKYTYYNY
ncbi:MAG: polysaccharide biosynthesis tyrosine autokinase [Calditrichia bacterium]